MKTEHSVLVQEEPTNVQGKPLGYKRYVLTPSDAAKRGELSEAAEKLLALSGDEVQKVFAKLSDR